MSRAKLLDMTQDFIKSKFNYDPETGVLTWKVNPTFNKLKGKRAGILFRDGYRRIKFNRETLSEHRVIWLWMTGEDPGVFLIDHINHKKDDNRWVNLRLATHGENKMNSKFGGVNRGILQINDHFRVEITKNGTTKYITLPTLKEARIVREKLEKALFGEFSCDRAAS